jgi:hypothetical protein
MSKIKNKQLVWPPPKPKFERYDSSWFANKIVTDTHFDIWWSEYIEPLGPGVEVTGFKESDGTIKYGDYHSSSDTHSAILIGITEIHEPTADELLAAVMDGADDHRVSSVDYQEALTKARAYLAKKRGAKYE